MSKTTAKTVTLPADEPLDFEMSATKPIAELKPAPRGAYRVTPKYQAIKDRMATLKGGESFEVSPPGGMDINDFIRRVVAAIPNHGEVTAPRGYKFFKMKTRSGTFAIGLKSAGK